MVLHACRLRSLPSHILRPGNLQLFSAGSLSPEVANAHTKTCKHDQNDSTHNRTFRRTAVISVGKAFRVITFCPSNPILSGGFGIATMPLMQNALSPLFCKQCTPLSNLRLSIRWPVRSICPFASARLSIREVATILRIISILRSEIISLLSLLNDLNAHQMNMRFL